MVVLTSNRLLSRLLSITAPAPLVGLCPPIHSQSLTPVVLSVWTTTPSKALEEEKILPLGINLVGILLDGAKEDINKRITSDLKSLWAHITMEGRHALIALRSSETITFYRCSSEGGKFEMVEEEVQGRDDNLLEGYTTLEARFDLPIQFNYQRGHFDTKLRETLKEGVLDRETTFVRFGNSPMIHPSTETSTSLLDATGSSTTKPKLTGYEVLHVTAFEKLSRNDPSLRSFAPSVEYSYENSVHTQMNVSLSVVAYLPSNYTLSVVADHLLKAATAQLRQFESVQGQEGPTNVSIFHFQPDGADHVISVLYKLSPDGTEDHLLERRRELHELLGLKMDRPFFRIANSIQFAPSTSKSHARIRNVHDKINLVSQVPGGKQYHVDGDYDYYHYMQDNFNDNGWGCAYRSMQTICSWIRNSHYTNKPVPSHQEIQELLVSMGDKEKKFIGSSQWIGAIEISMCLSTLYDVDCSIMHLSSGAEMATKGRELIHHFETQGSPVMIGGGVLAYTLIGVDYNEKTGDIRFLILDPHYTGGEDTKVIRDKGWCGWKTADLFRKDSFYNLCLPKRPNKI